ncbi:AGAP001614-PA-like protein [Anopheles sinensis]|uniref:AGAP001614-PA-like protein n=1 Tax=Anopheles sinensis TaxID=74873 RepID=A0A084W377_ANOSI|nr:AGAP001614-PA-like protein [Anopheles sinensis]
MSIKLDYRNNLRGIRKCPRCDSFNGNRATRCKNRSCQHKLRADTNGDRKVPPTQPASAVQLLPNYAHLYSVHLRPGVRTFVETPTETDGTITVASIASGLASVSVESDDLEMIKQRVSGCQTVASALPLIKAIVDTLLIPEEEKRILWERETQCNMPLVQRMGNDLFAVGRLQSSFGLCHVTAQKKNQKYSHFHCDCRSDGDQHQMSPDACWHTVAVVAGLLSAAENPDERWVPLLRQFVGQKPVPEPSDHDLRCTYEAVPSVEGHILTDQLPVVGQSIETMLELFSDDVDVQPGLISLDSLMDMPTDGPVFELAIGDTMIDPPAIERGSPDVITTSAESLQLMDCQIELMDEFDLTDRIDFCPSDIECDESMLLPDDVFENLSVEVEPKEGKKEKLVEVTAKKAALRQGGRVEKEKLTRGSYNVRKLMKALESNGIIFNRLQRNRSSEPDESSRKTSPLPAYEATLCNLSFTQWLESVIEQLNAIIDYNTNGKPEAQTFRIHEDFFRCIRARFSVGHRLRQPDETSSSERTESRTHLFRFTHHKSLACVREEFHSVRGRSFRRDGSTGRNAAN